MKKATPHRMVEGCVIVLVLLLRSDRMWDLSLWIYTIVMVYFLTKERDCPAFVSISYSYTLYIIGS